MKKRLVVCVCVGLIALWAGAVVSCNLNGNVSPIVGTWTLMGLLTYKFNADGTCSVTSSGLTLNGTYTVDENASTLTTTLYGSSTTYTYQLSNNNNSLTLTSSGSSVTYNRV